MPQRTNPCADQVESVDTSDLFGIAAESQTDADRAKEEWRDQQSIAGSEPTELSGIPDDLECIEGQAFGDGEAGNRGDAEQRGRRRERRRIPFTSQRWASVMNVPLAPKPKSAMLMIM